MFRYLKERYLYFKIKMFIKWKIIKIDLVLLKTFEPNLYKRIKLILRKIIRGGPLLK